MEYVTYRDYFTLTSIARYTCSHQKIQVPKIDVLTYVSSMQGLCKGSPTPKTAYKVHYLHFW